MNKKNKCLKVLEFLMYFIVFIKVIDIEICGNAIVLGTNPVTWALGLMALNIKLTIILMRPFLREEIR